jgi:hypothetical protein
LKRISIFNFKGEITWAVSCDLYWKFAIVTTLLSNLDTGPIKISMIPVKLYLLNLHNSCEIDPLKSPRFVVSLFKCISFTLIVSWAKRWHNLCFLNCINLPTPWLISK